MKSKINNNNKSTKVSNNSDSQDQSNSSLSVYEELKLLREENKHFKKEKKNFEKEIKLLKKENEVLKKWKALVEIFDSNQPRQEKIKKIYIMSMSPFLRKIEKGIFYEIFIRI